jgi:cation transport regulator ChaB
MAKLLNEVEIENVEETKESKQINEYLETAPYKNKNELPVFIKSMPEHAQEIFMSTFNSVYEKDGDEGRAMAIAISAAKRWCKKNGYTYNKETKTWNK